MMQRSFFVAAALCVACTHQQQMHGLETTTTSATIRDTHGAATLEAQLPSDESVSSAPAALPSNSPDDARIAAAVEAYDDAAVARASFAMDRAKDSRVRDYAQLVRDRHHDAKMRLSNLTVTPGGAAPPASLQQAVGPSQLDFDREYVTVETREQNALLQLIDHATPETKTVELRKRLVDLRPQIADLWVRGFELEQILAAP